MQSIINNVPRNAESTSNATRNTYNSKWEYSKAVSRWHFDKWKTNDLTHKVFMNISPSKYDLQKELENLTYEVPVDGSNYGPHGAKLDNLIVNDMKNWGYEDRTLQFERTFHIPQILQDIAAELHLTNPDVRIHRQKPGMVAHLHTDSLSSHPAMVDDPTLDVSQAKRFIIQLSDWDWGHFWAFGNNNWTQWKAGDVAYFESRDIPHCTANSGKAPRYTMTVTGWLTDKTVELVDGDFKKVII